MRVKGGEGKTNNKVPYTVKYLGGLLNIFFHVIPQKRRILGFVSESEFD